jgi:hypothetical protein
MRVRGYVVWVVWVVWVWVVRVAVGVTPVGLFASGVVLPQPVRRVKERTRAINVRVFFFNIVKFLSIDL